MTPHVLVVDDDPMLCKLLNALLTDEGYNVATLDDPRAVMPYLNDHTIDLAILDVSFPAIDGFALATMLRRTRPNMPIIFLSARVLTEDKVRGLNLGDDYLTKPFEPAELLARVSNVLRRYRRAGRNRSET